jgi:hypothetical protein
MVVSWSMFCGGLFLSVHEWCNEWVENIIKINIVHNGWIWLILITSSLITGFT